MIEIKNYPKYAINKNGEVWSYKYKKYLKPYLRAGYLSVQLYENKIVKWHLIHRLLAQTFIPNPHNKLQVNHIDGNKLNNDINNLEWVTTQENMKHAWKLGLYKQCCENSKSKHTKSEHDFIVFLSKRSYSSSKIKKFMNLSICKATINRIIKRKI